MAECFPLAILLVFRFLAILVLRRLIPKEARIPILSSPSEILLHLTTSPFPEISKTYCLFCKENLVFIELK